MENFYIQITDGVVIENIENKNTKNLMSEHSFKKLLDAKKHDLNYIFIISESLYNTFSDFSTISSYYKSNIVLIQDNNIDNYKDKEMKNVYYFINDESLLFDNVKSIINNVSGFIEFKIQELEHYNKDVLEDQLEKISDLVVELEKTKCPVIKQLNGFKMQEKFNAFGENSFFVDSNLNIYNHPSLYYSQQKPLCKLDEFDGLDEFKNHFTKPHLMCMACETFYCDRDIYRNKIMTSEYMVPCSNTCATTTLFSKYSKKIFNELTNQNIVIENLDKVEEFEPVKFYAKLKENKVFCNIVKKINFKDRELV